MAEVTEEKQCSNPGCDQPGTKACSACKTSFYCGPICQTADWTHHKEECDGHLRKVGKANLEKARVFGNQQNWVQSLRYGELAATKLKQLKDRRLETVQTIDKALGSKFDAYQRLGRHREALECAKECYTLWAMNHLRNPGSMEAALLLIQSCIHNKEYEDAENYARHAYFMIAEMADNFIPSDQYPQFLADASYWLAMAIFRWAEAGGIPPEGKQKAGEEAIKHARKALEIHTQLFEIENIRVAADIGTLADVLNTFSDVNDDEVARLMEQAISIFRRVEGVSSANLAIHNYKLANIYINRANRAAASNDMDRWKANSELILTHYREAARIYRAANLVDMTDETLRNIAEIEAEIKKGIRLIEMTKAAAAESEI